MYISVYVLPVKDLDRAIEFYTKKLGWEVTMDAPMGEGARWVTVAPKGEKTEFSLMVEGPEFSRKAGENSGIIIEVDDVRASHTALEASGVEFTEAPRVEPWGGWAMFKDSEGNVHGLHSAVPAEVSAN